MNVFIVDVLDRFDLNEDRRPWILSSPAVTMMEVVRSLIMGFRKAGQEIGNDIGWCDTYTVQHVCCLLNFSDETDIRDLHRPFKGFSAG